VLAQYHVGFAAGDELVPYLAWRGVPVSAASRVGLLRADGARCWRGALSSQKFASASPYG
jgi:hypothetical protein